MKLKLYTDFNWIPKSHKPNVILSTLWNLDIDQEIDSSSPDFKRYDFFKSNISNYFETTDDITKADLAIMLIEYRPEYFNLFYNLSNYLYKKNSIKLLVIFNNDFDKPLKLKNTIILRTSFYKNEQLKNEFSIPGWSSQPHIKNINIAKDLQPSISYCGYIKSLKKKSLKNSLLGFKNYLIPTYKKKGAYFRKKAFDNLHFDERIKTNFIIRDSFFGNIAENKIILRNEYYENIMSSLYALVIRGEGNYSYRLYEVMSCGRIPVFVNTNCVLPYDWIIPYKDIFIWIEYNEIDKIGDKILEYHSKNTNEQLIALQDKIKDFYINYISTIGYFSNFKKILQHERILKKSI